MLVATYIIANTKLLEDFVVLCNNVHSPLAAFVEHSDEGACGIVKSSKNSINE